MARTRSKRQQQLQQAVMIPVDWLEERSGLVGGIKYFLFRKVPAETTERGGFVANCGGSSSPKLRKYEKMRYPPVSSRPPAQRWVEVMPKGSDGSIERSVMSPTMTSRNPHAGL